MDNLEKQGRKQDWQRADGKSLGSARSVHIVRCSQRLTQSVRYMQKFVAPEPARCQSWSQKLMTFGERRPVATLKVRNPVNRTFLAGGQSTTGSNFHDDLKSRSKSSNLSRRQRFSQNRNGRGSWREYVRFRKRVGNDEMSMPFKWRF